MDAVILAAGYGTRLQRDLNASSDPNFESLKGVPKPLLPIGGIPLITRWVKALKACDAIGFVHVVTNATNHSLFEEWAKEFEGVVLHCDGSTSNETRSGAVAAISLCCKESKLENIVVVGGDTLFLEDFNLTHKLDEYAAIVKADPTGSLVLGYAVSDDFVHKVGILEVEENEIGHKVVNFLEKPSAEETAARLACPCFYMLSSPSVAKLEPFLEKAKSDGLPLAKYDAPGNFIAMLVNDNEVNVYCSTISGRYDVGGLATYIECDEEFKKREKTEE
eukprot:m.128065 g.128065  ORF g.128065 m.128065 type:complete len:277 (-) comp13018_c1_seq1:601-1431(-)